MASKQFYLVGVIKKKPRTEWRYYVGERGSHDLPDPSELTKSDSNTARVKRYEKFADNTPLFDGTESTQQYVVLRWQKHHGLYRVMHYFSTRDAAVVWCRGTLHKHHSWDGFQKPEFAEELPAEYLASVKTFPGIVSELVDDVDKALRSDNVERVKNVMDSVAEALTQARSAEAVLAGKERQLKEKFAKWMK